jgi:polyhydroxybutyrate depolymerase
LTDGKTTKSLDVQPRKEALVVIEGGGHTWPGMRSPANTLGKSALNVSANDLMWEFFQNHKLK